jgi:hypothetical protein
MTTDLAVIDGDTGEILEPSAVARRPAGQDIGAMRVRTLEDIERVAVVIARSNMYPDVKTKEAAAVKMWTAMSMGFAPMTGLTGVDIIEGSPSPSAHLWAAAIEASPLYDFEVRERTNERCVIAFLRRQDGGEWRERGVVEWTLEDAQRAELAGKANWRRYPRAMLHARAMAEGARAFCPELFGGARAYGSDELGQEYPATAAWTETPNEMPPEPKPKRGSSPKKSDTDALNAELEADLSDDQLEEFKREMKVNGISSADLADPLKLAEAKRIRAMVLAFANEAGAHAAPEVGGQGPEADARDTTVEPNVPSGGSADDPPAPGEPVQGVLAEARAAHDRKKGTK